MTLSDEEAAFLQAIIESPADDAVRLVFADWLEDHDQPERAEFIRAQIEIEGLDPATSERWRALQIRTRMLLALNAAEWLGPIHGGLLHRLFRRGFLEEAQVYAAPLAEHADALFRRWPVFHLHIESGAALCMEAIADIPYLARLRRLDLRANGLEGGHVRTLARSPHIAGLTWLRLNHNPLGDEGARALAESPYLGRLNSLLLDYTQIDDDGLLALAESPHLTSLRSLHLSGIRVDRRRRGCRALRERFGDGVLP